MKNKTAGGKRYWKGFKKTTVQRRRWFL